MHVFTFALWCDVCLRFFWKTKTKLGNSIHCSISWKLERLESTKGKNWFDHVFGLQNLFSQSHRPKAVPTHQIAIVISHGEVFNMSQYHYEVQYLSEKQSSDYSLFVLFSVWSTVLSRHHRKWPCRQHGRVVEWWSGRGWIVQGQCICSSFYQKSNGPIIPNGEDAEIPHHSQVSLNLSVPNSYLVKSCHVFILFYETTLNSEQWKLNLFFLAGLFKRRRDTNRFFSAGFRYLRYHPVCNLPWVFSDHCDHQ